jgi:hypothetical protein
MSIGGAITSWTGIAAPADATGRVNWASARALPGAVARPIAKKQANTAPTATSATARATDRRWPIQGGTPRGPRGPLQRLSMPNVFMTGTRSV